MNKKTPPPKPTDAELELLRVLWENGSATVRKIHEALPKAKSTRYTTTLKILQKMTDKGLVTRDESRKSHIYHATIEPEKTQRQLVRHLLQGAFGGNPTRLVMQALAEERATPDELDKIREMLNELDTQSKPGGKKE